MISRERVSFKIKFSTLDYIYTLKQTVKKNNDYSMPLSLAFIDYQKVFDSVKITAVITALEKQGIESVCVNIIKKIYNNSTSIIKLHKCFEVF